MPRSQKSLPLHSIGPWHPGHFLICCFSDVETASGWIYRGLAMRFAFPGSPKGRRPPGWVLTHMGSGHAVCTIDAHETEAFAIATEIAECGEWDFDGLRGYINRDPTLREKYGAVAAKYPKQISRVGGPHQNDAAAAAVVMARSE